MDLTYDIGLEKLQRAVAVLIAENINDAIDAVDASWTARDVAWLAAVGRPDPDFTIEHIPPDNVYAGTIPSLIQSGPEKFPNCSVIAYVATPAGVDQDVLEHYSIILAVEFMVKHLTSEEVVNTRIQRTLEAAHSVLISDENRRIPDFDGPLVPTISSMPTVTISDVFVIHPGGSPTERNFYQHGSLTYRIDKYSAYGNSPY